MTSIWGPMGWMTLHSVSLLYPDTPTVHDKQIAKRFVQDFAESLTCPHCERHFKTMVDNYQRSHPEWMNSRFDFFLFTVRAHNTVNRRLEKPLKKSVEEALRALAVATTYISFVNFRKRYIDYVIKTMAREMSGDTMIKVGHGQNMQRINESYWNSRILSDTSSFPKDANVLEFISDSSATQSFLFGGSNARPAILSSQLSIGLKGGRLRLNRG